ncbi:MAG: PKD domain-containing protein [Anaerolineales bacterium]|nr:PKD domain-containing protein [Anaerolineales bacterium]
MKRSTFLFLSLAALVSLLLFNSQRLLASPTADPSLTIGSATVAPNTVVTLPITFDNGGNNISSLVFSVDFDPSLLLFDNSDNNLDGIPDAIDFNVPVAFAPSVTFDASDTDGELDFAIFDFAPPLASLPSGDIATITFTTADVGSEVVTAVNFSTDPSASFGSNTGQSIPGTTTNGSVTIVVSPELVAQFSAVPLSGEAPLLVNFTDESTSTPTSWQWDFGDGTSSTSQNPSHTYTNVGVYTVKLTVFKDAVSASETKTNYITVTAPVEPPIANFEADNQCGPNPLTVQFTDLSTGNPNSWLWNFGDGSTSTSQHPSHTYTALGSYTVSLTVSNSVGNDTESKTNYILVDTVCSLVADFAASPQSGSVPLTVQFNDLSQGNPTGWQWSFGDGSSSNAQNPVHTYTQPGFYTVSLTATNATSSDSETKTSYIVVEKARLFMPVIKREHPTAVFGRVTTAQGQGLAGVVIATNTGKTAVTDANGNYILGPLGSGSYTLTPNKPNYTFDPAARPIFVPPNAKGQDFVANPTVTITPTPTLTPTPTNTPQPGPKPNPTSTPQPSCSNYMGNGGFESSSHWVINNNEYPASYSTVQRHGGNRSMRVGIINSGDNQFAYSSVSQTLTLPGSATDATLRFWLYTSSTGTLVKPEKTAVIPTNASETSLTDDAQYVLAYDSHGNQYTLLFQRSNQGWTQYQANLGSLAGQQITLYFGVYNNGFGGVTGMYVDDVELISCR